MRFLDVIFLQHHRCAALQKYWLADCCMVLPAQQYRKELFIWMCSVHQNKVVVTFFLCVFQIGGGHNIHELLLKVAEMVIRESRAVRVQPFNEYRKKFNLKPYRSFYEFTGEQEWYCNLLLRLSLHTPLKSHKGTLKGSRDICYKP